MQNLDILEPLTIFFIFAFLFWVIGVRIALVLAQVRQGGHLDRDIMALLKRAGTEMAEQPPEQEAAEVAYLLETIGGRMDRDAYRRVLEEIQVGVATRLQAAQQ